MANETRKKLYTAVNNAGFDIGDYNDFDKRMNNAEDRKKFYDAVNDAGFDIGDYNDYERRIAPSKYNLTIGGKETPVSEKQYKDFVRSHSSSQPASGTQQLQARKVQPQAKAQAKPQTATPMATTQGGFTMPEGFGEADFSRGVQSPFLQEQERKAHAHDKQLAKQGLLGRTEEQKREASAKAQAKTVQKAIHGDEDAVAETGLDSATQQLRDRMDYYNATGKELKDDVLDLTSIGIAPTVARDENGEIMRNEDGTVIKGQVSDPVRAATQAMDSERMRVADLDRQIEEANDELLNLKKEIDKIETPGYVYSQDALSPYADPRTTNTDLASLSVAYTQLQEKLKGLQVERAGGQKGFFNGMLTAAKDPSTWLLGLDKLSNTAEMLRVSEKVKSGQELTDSEKKMLDATMANNAVQGKLSEDSDWLYRAGAMTTQMIPFALQIGFTGGFGSVAEMGATGGEKLAARYAAKYGEEALINRVNANIIRGLGVTFGDVAAGFCNAVTTGAANTAVDAMERRIGDLGVNEKGEYQFTGDDDWIRAIGKAVVSQTKEFATERFGEHLPSLREMNVWFAKQGMGARKIARALSGFAGTKAMQNTAAFLRKGGINGVGGEILEEEIGLPIDIAIGDMTWEDALSGKTQWDICGGMLLSMGAMHATGLAAQGVGKTYNTAQYYKYKNRADKSAHKAATMMGNDAWRAMQEKIDGTETQNMETVWEDIRNNESLSDKEKRAAFDYMNALTLMRGYNMGMFFSASEAAKNPALMAEVKPTTKKEQDEIDVMQSRDRGYNLETPQEQNDAKNMRDYTRQQLEELVSEDMMRQFDEDPMTALYIIHDNEQWSDEEKQKALDYVNAKATYDGMIQSVRDRIETETQQATEEIDSRVASEEQGGDGKIHPATMKADNRQVYIVSGNVRMLDDGSMVDRENSDKDLIVRDAETGKVEFVSIDDILRTDEVEDAEQLKQEAVHNIQETVATEASNAIDGVLSFEPNSNFTIMSDDGVEHTVQVVQDQGDGTVAVLLDGATDAVPMAKEQLQEMSEAYNMSRLQQYEAEKAVERAEEAQEQSETPEGAEEVAEGAEGTQAQETPTEEEVPMPMIGEGEDAEPDFASVTPERAHKYVYEESGLDEQTADEFVANNAKAAKTALDKAVAKKPKIGTNIAKYNKEKAQYDANVQAAQEQVDYWNGVKAQRDAVIAQRNAERAAERKAIEEREKAKAEAEEAARQAEIIARQEEEQGLGAITPVSKEEFKKWVNSSHRKTKPFAEYSSVKPLEENKKVTDTKEEDAEIRERINEYRKEYPDNMVFPVRHADGSATYYDNDARIVAELLGVELDGTKLTVDKEQFDKSLQKLIATGRRVGMLKSDNATVELSSEQPEQEKTAEKKATKPKKDASAPKTSGARTSDKGKIGDVGERLEGARKDMLKVLSKTFEDATVQALIELPFSKAFKKPDLKKAVESGALREEDALFYETLFALMNTNKPKVTKSELWKKKNYENYETSVDKWAKQTHNTLSFLKEFVEATPEQRDIMMRTMMENHYPERDKELADIEQRKRWNKDYTYVDADGKEHEKKHEWGDKTTPNTVWVMHEILSRLGYEVGDKMDIPYGVIKASADGLYYGLTDNKNDKNYAIGTFASIEDAIDAAVYLAKVKRGDTDLQHPKRLFSVVHTKTTYKDSGKYRVVYGRNLNEKQFDSKEEADKFVKEKEARAISAYASPIQEVDERTDYVITFYHPLTGKKMQIDNEKFATKAEALTYLSENMESVNEAVNEKLRAEAEQKGQKKEITADDMMHVSYAYDVANKTASYAVYINKEVANNYGMPVMLRDGFQSREEAKQWLEEHKAEVFDIHKKAEAQRKAYVYFSSGQDTRVGEDYRNGKDVTAEDFMNEFGFRGVQFGNWTNQADRQMAINQAYDALIDLARLLGVSPRAISLNGKLGIAFGSRGSGNANAHFEPGEFVINLTKTKGAGSLAHEWWHAMDNYFAKNAGVEQGYVTETTTLEMRQELRDAFNAMIDMVRNSDYYERSRLKGAYWGRTIEVTARLFAEWVDRELKKRGELNTFLSRGADIEKWQKMTYYVHEATSMMAGKEPMPFDEFKETKESLKGYPFPSEKEVTEMGDAVRNIFETMQERIDEESGAVALFHKASEEASEVSEQEGALRDALVETMRNAGIEVVADEQEGQRVLDIVNGENATLSKAQKRAAETATLSETSDAPLTVVSTADGAKVLNNLDELTKHYDNLTKNNAKTFLGDIAKALGAKKHGSNSQYATFETKNGQTVTIRLANHNAKVSTFDNHGEDNGISIVVSHRANQGVTNDGQAHVVEYYYPETGLRKAEGKPLADIVRAIKQSLYSGEFNDPTGIAERQEVNDEQIRLHKVRFFRTRDGKAYGFVKDGKMYIDPSIATSETPVHEYTHLWAEALRKGNPEKWEEIKRVLLNDESVKPFIDEVRKKYPELTNEDDLLDEVLAQYSGKRGSERLRAEAQRIADSKDGAFEKADVFRAMNKLKDAIRRFWQVFADFMHIPYRNADEIADRVMYDLLSGVNPRQEAEKMQQDPHKARQLEIVTKENPMRDDYHTGIRSIDDIKTYEEAVNEGEGMDMYPDFTEEDARKALESGEVTVYSSNPIENGVFVSTSRKEAEDYAGGGKVYSKRVPLSNVAWLQANEGQYAEDSEKSRDEAYKEAVENGDAEAAQRMVDAAAESAGYEYKVYHQTDNDFTVFDPRHKGSGTNDYLMPFGIFLKPTDRNIGINGEKQMPLYAKINNPLRFADREELQNWLDENIDGYRAAREGYERIDKDFKKRFDEQEEQETKRYTELWNRWKAGEISEEEYQQKISETDGTQALLDEWKEAVNKQSAVMKELVDAYMRDSEYDGIIVNNDRGSFGRQTQTILVFEPEQVKSADVVTYDDAGNIIPLSKRFNSKEPDIRFQKEETNEQVEGNNNEQVEEDDSVLMRDVDDEELIEQLEREPKVKVYRSMVLIDGKLYPPMSSKSDGKLRKPSELGKWEEAEEALEKAKQGKNGKWYFSLKKDNGKSVDNVAYNPYIHTSTTMLNDQFMEAQSRDNLVVVEMEVPVSELTSGYRAEKAHDTTGVKQWKAGPIQGQLTGTREVILTRWAKPIRIVPTEEVAQSIAEQIDGQVRVMPSNVVTPQVREALEALGVQFVETDNKGKLTEGVNVGKTWVSVYGNKKTNKKGRTMQREGDGRVLSMSQDKNYSRKQRWELMQREWKRMQNKAKEYIDILKLDRIAVYGTVEDMPEGMRNSLSERKKKAKGWYDTKTGKIVIILGNHRNAEDVAKTILHEAVAHYGLRKLFGKNFDTFLDNVYQNADVDVKMRIADMAARQRAKDSAANRARRTTEDYLRIGTEEYLAKLAEDMDFENRRESFWSKIKSHFIQMLESIGLKDYDAGVLSDNELKYILWRSYKNLSSPGEYRNVFDVAEDVVMQENLGVGNFTRGEMPESMLLPSEIEERKRVAEQGIVGEDDRFNDTDDGEIASEEELNSYDAGKMSLSESITQGLIKLARENKDNLQLRVDAMRALNGDIQKLRSAMSRQRDYDRSTVDSIVRLARMVMGTGYFNNFSNYEVRRLLSAINNATGKEDITHWANTVVDILMQHQLREAKELFERQMRVRGSKVDSRGVEVQAGLDITGQRIVSAFKDAMEIVGEETDSDGNLTAWGQRIADVYDRMGSDDEVTAQNAAAEYQGMMLAKQWYDEVRSLEQEEKNLRADLKDAKERKRNGQMSYDEYKQFVKATEDAIRENRMERIEGYGRLAVALGTEMRTSVEKAKAFREDAIERVNEIHHNANSDLEGIPADEHRKLTWQQSIANWSIVRFFMKPLATFDEMLRFFGSKSVDGKGYLWNRFMGGWTDAADREWKQLKAAHEALDKKASEVFGKNMKWSDIFSMERKMPTITVEFWDGGERKNHQLTAGNALYIYMVNKMTDGKMKLRKMGITEEDVANIAESLDPRLIQLADWLQDDFLVNKRKDYNAVHERMFGAPMAAIDNYFPLRINDRSRGKEEEIGAPTTAEARPSTVTGSVIKRVRNTTALDIMGTDAFDVVLEHLQEMEHWAAFAELSRDLNTLCSYKRFRNRVLNMSSVRFGAGETLWKNFKDCCAIAAGVYTPMVNRNSLDTAMVNVAKGVTAAKISFRIYTALKQLLSYPAYLSEANIVELAKTTFNPVGAAQSWNWAIENLPGFAERWQSRRAGDSRLLDTDADWQFWRNKIVETASRWGMSPNAFVDGLTVSMGAKAIYETKKKRYLADGYSEEDAEKKALLDASVAYNETQQSSMNAYLSAMQVDRTAASVALTVFRNASMAYQRRMFRAMSNLRRKMRRGYKNSAIEYMAKQYQRNGLGEGEAQVSAIRDYNHSWYEDVANTVIFGFVMQFAWNLGPYLAYMIGGDDDDDKEGMLVDAALHALAGSIEGLTGGSVMSELYNMLRKGESVKSYNFNLLPLMSDVQNILRKLDKDKVEAANDIINLLVQAGIGVNPQSLTDAFVAVMDYSGGDYGHARETALLILRIMNCPQSQLDKLMIDELGMTARDAQKLSVEDIAYRYAEYKVRRGAPLTGWAYSDEGEYQAAERKQKLFNEKVGERVKRLSDGDLESVFNRGDNTLRKLAGKEAAERMGGKDTYGSPSKNNLYGQVYSLIRDYNDMAEDILLQNELKKAKQKGDTDRVEEINAAIRDITSIKKDLAETPFTLEDGTEITDKDVMKDLREVRKEYIKELVK